VLHAIRSGPADCLKRSTSAPLGLLDSGLAIPSRLVRDGANRLAVKEDAKDSLLSNKTGRALSVSKC
jgi:hypothetical protein